MQWAPERIIFLKSFNGVEELWRRKNYANEGYENHASEIKCMEIEWNIYVVGMIHLFQQTKCESKQLVFSAPLYT